MKYIAKEGYVFDYAEPRYEMDEQENEVQIHLNAKILWLGVNDSIENYKEIKVAE